MKQRLGALLCLALGAVLITTGLTESSGATIGLATATCGAPVIGSVTLVCPTGTIAITESTVLPSGATATPPAGGWQVDITSSCLNPGTGLPVSLTVTIADGGTGTSDPLFVYTSQAHTTKCTYTLSEHAVAGFTAVFAPTSPVDLPFNNTGTGNDRKVDLTNTAAVVTSSAAPTSTTPSTPAPSTSASTSTSTSPSAVETTIDDS